MNSPGLIDAGYRDEISVPAREPGSVEPFKISRGDRIAELVIQRFETVEWNKSATSMTPSEAWAAGAPPDSRAIGSPLVTHRNFRFGVITPSAVRARSSRSKRASRGPQLLVVLRPRPPHRPRSRADRRTGACRRGHRDDARRPARARQRLQASVVPDVATLDLLPDGRLELGIGAGWMTADYEKAGMPLIEPARIARLAESITVLKGLFAPARSPFTATTTKSLISTACRNRRKGRTPVPHRRRGQEVPRARGTRSQIVGINANLRTGEGESRETAKSLLPAATDQKLAWLREAAGDGFDNFEIQTLLGFAHVTPDPSASSRRSPSVRRLRG